MEKKTVLIVGLGLIGGSLAMALTRSGKYIVVGADCCLQTVEEALDAGAIARPADPNSWGEADIVMLCVAPLTAVELLKQHIGELRANTVVTDVCGVKGAIVADCTAICRPHGVHFVGAHPMAGREKNGFEHADGDLFRQASYILTPDADTPETAVDAVRDLAMAVGCARVTVTTPENHDRMIAYTSQIPHVLAGSYVSSPCCAEHVGYAAGSYRDVSRVATIDETLWSELFLLNREALGAELDELIGHLQAYRDALTVADRDRLQELIRFGRECKQKFG
ncbi:MAG: prephenate dehydrogenase/arogenate dehydrogenase family protein [Clostridia bacterium]|nr:prephenate dehydrogenase/arogenate dehydrogenase family protein [Clostridia bacterium]